MSARAIFVALVLSGVLSYGLFTAFLQLTLRQFIALVWAIAAAAGLYAADRLNLLDRPLWLITHLQEPAAQAFLVSGGPTPGRNAGKCSFTGVVDRWAGRVETAFEGKTLGSQYLRIEVGPGLVFTNALRFDAASQSPAAQGVGGQPKPFSTGDEILISGVVDDPAGLCEASYANDGSYTLLLSPTRLERVQGLLVQSWMVLTLAWTILVLPAVALAGSRMQLSGVAMRPKVIRASSAPLDAVSSGTKGLDIPVVIAAFRHAKAASDDDAARHATEQLEAAQVETNEEWLVLSAFFQSVKRPMSERIATERYLTAHPDDSDAQLRLAQILDAGKQDQRRVRTIAATVAERTNLTTGQLLGLGTLFTSIGNQPAAITTYQRLLDGERSHLEGHSRLLRLLIDKPDAGVDGMLTELRAMIPDVEYWYVTCADYASRRKNLVLFHECVACVRPRVHMMDVYWNRRLVDAHIRLGKREPAEQIYIDVDYAAIASEIVCKRLLDVAEHYGFTKASFSACRRLLEIAPSKPLEAKFASLRMLNGSGPAP